MCAWAARSVHGHHELIERGHEPFILLLDRNDGARYRIA